MNIFHTDPKVLYVIEVFNSDNCCVDIDVIKYMVSGRLLDKGMCSTNTSSEAFF